MTQNSVNQILRRDHPNKGRKQSVDHIRKRVESTKITMARMPHEDRQKYLHSRAVSCERISAKDTIIYILVDPRDLYEIRYLGKTVSTLAKRKERHKGQADRGIKYHVYNWWRKMTSEGVEPIIIQIDLVPAGEDWTEVETRWIKKFKKEGHRLTNQCDGGQGSTGSKRSEETVQRLRDSHRGKVASDKTRLKQGVVSKAAWKRNPAPRCTPESLAKMHATRAIRRAQGLYKKRSPSSPESIEKMRKTKKENHAAGLVVLSPEGWEKISQASKARHAAKRAAGFIPVKELRRKARAELDIARRAARGLPPRKPMTKEHCEKISQTKLAANAAKRAAKVEQQRSLTDTKCCGHDVDKVLETDSLLLVNKGISS